MSLYIVVHYPGREKVLSLLCTILRKKVFLMLTDSPKGAGGESSSLDEDSSDALSPDQPNNHDSPLSAVPQLSPSERLSQNGDMSPPQVKKQKLVYRRN